MTPRSPASPQPSVFRPCIDLHNGAVKQIVGGSLDTDNLKTNFVSEFVAPSRVAGCGPSIANSRLTPPRRHPSSYYADLYRKHNLTGGHVIKLGPGNDKAAREALQAWPGSFMLSGCSFGGPSTDDSSDAHCKGGLQIGGGITEENAQEWLDAGAEKVRGVASPATTLAVLNLAAARRSLSPRTSFPAQSLTRTDCGDWPKKSEKSD